MKRILAKLVCFHKWESHNKTEENHSSAMNQGTVIREVLICSVCGRIKIIQY